MRKIIYFIVSVTIEDDEAALLGAALAKSITTFYMPMLLALPIIIGILGIAIGWHCKKCNSSSSSQESRLGKEFESDQFESLQPFIPQDPNQSAKQTFAVADVHQQPPALETKSLSLSVKKAEETSPKEEPEFHQENDLSVKPLPQESQNSGLSKQKNKEPRISRSKSEVKKNTSVQRTKVKKHSSTESRSKSMNKELQYNQ